MKSLSKTPLGCWLSLVLASAGAPSAALADSSPTPPPSTTLGPVAPSAANASGGAAQVTTIQEDPQQVNVVPAAPTAYPADNEAAAVAWLNAGLKQSRYPELFAATAPSFATETRPEVMWRMGRIIINYYEGKREAPDAEKLAHYKIVEDLARKCIAMPDSDQHPGCYLELGISMGRQGTLKGVLRSLRMAKGIEEAWLKGLELSKDKPQFKVDDDLMEAHFYYVLGILYRILPDWWIVKVIAGTRGDKVKAIDLHRKSVALRPDPSTELELGVALMCRGMKEDDAAQYQEGETWVKKVANVTPKTMLDRVDKKNAGRILAKPKLSCGYSRDKFQDVDSADKVK